MQSFGESHEAPPPVGLGQLGDARGCLIGGPQPVLEIYAKLRLSPRLDQRLLFGISSRQHNFGRLQVLCFCPISGGRLLIHLPHGILHMSFH